MRPSGPLTDGRPQAGCGGRCRRPSPPGRFRPQGLFVGIPVLGAGEGLRMSCFVWWTVSESRNLHGLGSASEPADVKATQAKISGPLQKLSDKEH